MLHEKCRLNLLPVCGLPERKGISTHLERLCDVRRKHLVQEGLLLAAGEGLFLDRRPRNLEET